jgi:hypothetical protein
MLKERNSSGRISSILIAISGICGHLALAVYYSGVLVPQQRFAGDLTTLQLMENIKKSQTFILLDAYLQGVGTLFSVIFFAGLVYLSGSGSRLSGWLVLITSAVMLTISLVDVTFTVAVVTAALAGHRETMRLAIDLITGSTEAFDYAFLFVPAPLLIISLAAVLLTSRLLPHIFGYLAIGIGVAFIAIGIISLFKTLAGSLGLAFEIVQLIQVLWVLGAAIFVLIYGQKRSKSESG